MTRLEIWIGVVAGVIVIRLFGSDVPLMEHLAGIYFSGCALLVHFFASAIRSRKP